LKDLGMFEIIKEESSSAGVRRIKATLKWKKYMILFRRIKRKVY
jgi:alanyl-tRNA synthetase